MNKRGGQGRSGAGGGKGGGERERRRWREEDEHLHMHEAPSTALFPQLLWRERRREGVGRGRETCGGAGGWSYGGGGTEEVVCMARGDWLAAGGWA